MGRKVLTESCVIQCCHGGTVEHPSSDGIRTIGGLKPNFTADILDAPVSGCPIPFTPCTKVAAIADAMTEPNVTGSGGTYALDVAGCQTDQGATLKIASRANTNSSSAVKAGTDNKVKGKEPTALEERKTKEKKEKEKYKLYLLRESQNILFKKIYKPLRPSQNFYDVQTFYGTLNTHPSIREKIVPFTLAFVYIKLHDNTIDEYRIINAGSLYAETFKDIKYKDENNCTNDYISLNDGEKIEIFYSNIQLSKDKKKRQDYLNNLTGVEFDPTTTNFFLKDPNSIDSNIIDVDTFTLQEKYDPVKEHEEKVALAKKEGKNADFKLYPLSVVMTVPDAIGQVEDMLNIYEWRYKMNYSKNDSFLNDIKKKNAYTYAVADKMDYFYVSCDEQKTYDTNITKLKELFRKLADEICTGSLASLVVRAENDIASLDEIITPAFDTAINYFNEVSHINKSFFKNILSDTKQSREERNRHLRFAYHEDEFRITSKGLSCTYHGRDEFVGAKKNNIAIRNIFEQRIKFKYNKENINYGNLIIKNEKDERYKAYQKNPLDMLALLVFAIYFSKEYKSEVEKSGLKDTAKDFYSTLKECFPLPAIGDENIKDIKTLIDTQKYSYAKIASNENKLLEQFESIDSINKKFSYDTTLIKSPADVFSDLYLPSDGQTFINSPQNPKDLLLKANELMQSEEFKKVILAYKKMDTFDDGHQEEYLHISQGLLYTFLKNRSDLDDEANISSPFCTKNKHLLEFAEHLSELKNGLKDETKKEKLFNLSIREQYTKVLHTHVSHSLIETVENTDGFSSRNTNAKAFLQKHKIKNEEQTLDLSNLLSPNFGDSDEKKKDIATYYSALLKIEGYTSKIGNVIEKYNKKYTEDNSFDSITSRNEVETTYTYNPKYKSLLSSIQTLSVFVAGINATKAIVGKEDLKYKDIFPLISDMYTTVDAFSKTIPKTKTAVVKNVQQFLGEDNFKKIASFKIMAKVGIISIAINAIYEIEQLEDADIDGSVAIVAKNITVIALLLAPAYLAVVPGIGWIAALGVLAVEVAWEFYIKDIFIDTPLESYVMKSLLYYDDVVTKGTKPYTTIRGYPIYRYTNDTLYETTLFKEAVNSEKKDFVKGFGSLKEVQNFIGDNYDEYAEQFNNAMHHELSSLQALASGYKIEIINITENKTYLHVEQKLKTKIKIPKNMLQNNIQVILSIDTKDTKIYESELTALGKVPSLPDDFTYDTIARKKTVNNQIELSNNIQEKEALDFPKKEVSLLLINRDITLKYKIEYHSYSIEPDPINQIFQALISLEIKKIKLTPLNSKDNDKIDKIVQIRKKNENTLLQEQQKKDT